MVSLKETSKAYYGHKAKTYEEHRLRQRRWHDENAAVAELLMGCDGPVLDCPVGTGRFLPLLKKMKLRTFGVDVSTEMLDQARRHKYGTLEIGDVTRLKYERRQFATTLCVRLFHLLDETSVRAAFKELDRVTSSVMVFNIKFGASGYRPGVNSAHHDRDKFFAMIKRRGWVLKVEIKQKGGWTTCRIERGS